MNYVKPFDSIPLRKYNGVNDCPNPYYKVA